MNFRKKLKLVANNKSKKSYKLYGNNKQNTKTFIFSIRLKEKFKKLSFKEMEDFLIHCSKTVKMSDIFNKNNCNLSIDQCIFLSRLYFKTNKQYFKFYFSLKLKIKDLNKILYFYLNEAKFSIDKIISYFNVYNLKDIYNYCSLNKVYISEDLKYFILERASDFYECDLQKYFFFHKDFKSSVDKFLNNNFTNIFNVLEDHNIFFYKDYFLLKKVKQIYEKNNKYNQFIKNICSNLGGKATLANVFDNLKIPRKHIYIGKNEPPKYFFSKKYPDPGLGVFY